MAGYIDRDAAVKAFNNFDAGRADSPPLTLLTPEEFAEYLYELPTADVVEVVRCNDCKNLVNTTINANWFLICDISDMEIAPEDFCSYGERREE